MSGLLVKSTVVMKENLQEMNTRGVAEKFPVLLGGAALTRGYVENDLADDLRGRSALRARRVRGPATDGHHHDRQARRRHRTPTAPRRSPRGRRRPSARPAMSGRNGLRPSARRPRYRSRCRSAPTSPPTSTCRSRRSGAPASSRASRSPTTPGCSTSVRCSWASGALRGQRGGEGPSYEELVETEGRPRLRYWLDRLSTDGILAHAAVVYGYFPAVSEGDDVDRAVRAETRCAGALPVHLPAPAARPVPVHRRLHPLAGTGRPNRTGRRAAVPVGDDGPADRRLRQRAVRRRTPTGTTSRCTASACS